MVPYWSGIRVFLRIFPPADNPLFEITPASTALILYQNNALLATTFCFFLIFPYIIFLLSALCVPPELVIVIFGKQKYRVFAP